jgi:hypothetical protein
MGADNYFWDLRSRGSERETAMADELKKLRSELERLKSVANAVLEVDAREGVYRAPHCMLEQMCLGATPTHSESAPPEDT